MANPLDALVRATNRRATFSVQPAELIELVDEPHLLAGVAEIDITPPPGLPKAGYSKNAQTGVGFRTRLRARVIHLRCGRQSLAWVACDLLGGSSVVQHLVADAISERTDIALAGLMIGATHTHAGPGQFLGTDFYNTFASNEAGFDPEWAAFLVERIAEGVIRAHDTRQPAAAAFGATEVWGLTRNRSINPYVRNETIVDRRTDPQRKWVAINPELHLLRVDTLSSDETGADASRPLGAMVVFSVHGTGVPQHADEYNADLWAYLVGELRHQITPADGHAPVVGAVEGTHADVAPALRPGLAGHSDAKRVGRAIGAVGADLWHRLGAELDASPTIAAGFREVDLDVDAQRTAGGTTLPKRPAVGAALVAGAHENLTPVISKLPPFSAGHPKRFRPGDQHGAKWVLGSRWLQPLIIRLRHFPRVVPLQVFRFNRSLIVGLPFEITVETGRRLAAAALNDVDAQHVDHAVICSVANEYSGYVATAEEYSLQHYEGGHTLYGPNTQKFLAAHLESLAAATVSSASPHSEALPTRRWDLAISRYLMTPTEHDGTGPVFDGAARFVDPTATEDGYWELFWLDASPSALRWHEPIASIESEIDGQWQPTVHDGRTVTDDGWDLEIRSVGVEPGGHRYRLRWYDPSHHAARRHRVKLVPNNGRPEGTSTPFS